VIFRKFDNTEAGIRVEREEDNKVKDDDRHLLKNEVGTFAPLEVIYIILYSLMNVSSGKIELVCIYYIYSHFYIFSFLY
jgi:hypothetical protein